eukprot:4193168-Pyramimonas_sp.AAC.1
MLRARSTALVSGARFSASAKALSRHVGGESRTLSARKSSTRRRLHVSLSMVASVSIGSVSDADR